LSLREQQKIEASMFKKPVSKSSYSSLIIPTYKLNCIEANLSYILITNYQ